MIIYKLNFRNRKPHETGSNLRNLLQIGIDTQTMIHQNGETLI